MGVLRHLQSNLLCVWREKGLTLQCIAPQRRTSAMENIRVCVSRMNPLRSLVIFQRLHGT